MMIRIELPRWRCAQGANRDLVRRPETSCSVATPGVIVNDFTVQTAGVAQPVEHRFCKPRVVSSSPTASSAGLWFSVCFGLHRVVRGEPKISGGYPSGQRGQTVNLVAMPSQVRILLHPCRFRLGWIGTERTKARWEKPRV
jgi:hypothetical protein